MNEMFAETLWTHLSVNLPNAINYTLWTETDALDDRSIERINQVIEAPFQDELAKYRGTPVFAILWGAMNFMKHAARIALNVPCPPWPMTHHLYRVVDNLMEFYNQNVRAHLRTEMIMTDHAARLIQRNWRRVVTDPCHPACQRRLLYDFLEISDLLNQHRDRIASRTTPEVLFLLK